MAVKNHTFSIRVRDIGTSGSVNIGSTLNIGLAPRKDQPSDGERPPIGPVVGKIKGKTPGK